MSIANQITADLSKNKETVIDKSQKSSSQTNSTKEQSKLFFSEEHLLLTLPKWFVLYTKSRHEKFVEKRLTEKGIESFTPTVLVRKKWSDRIKFIEQPLFRSYCFAKFPLKDKTKIVSEPGVVHLIHFKNKYVPVEDEVIDSLKILVENKVQLESHPYLKIGKRVRVKNGPLKGVEGYILEKRNKNTTLVISIEAINSSISCVVDIEDVAEA